MQRGQTTRPLSAGQAPPPRPPATVPPVSVSSNASVEAAGRLQSLAAQYAARATGGRSAATPGTAPVGEVALMLAWLAGYEAATQKAVVDVRAQIAGLNGAASLPPAETAAAVLTVRRK